MRGHGTSVAPTFLTIMKANRLYLSFVLLMVALTTQAADQFVSFTHGDVLIHGSGNVVGGVPATIFMDGNDERGVARAAQNLCVDFGRVTGVEAKFVKSVVPPTAARGGSDGAYIIVGTLGHSALLDRLVKDKRIDLNQLKGKREMYVIQLVGDQLVIAGSDRRGTIFGIYELSRQLGVSPWYYWADVPTEHHDGIYVNRGTYTDGEPAVRYRGIFLNDEAPCLTSWVKNTFNTNYGGHEFYEKVFELILRLKGNFLWPAMWSWSFYADDPLNSPLADEMGVIMGTSHHEPMARNHQEWARHRAEYGAWNYQTNQEVIDRFFREGIERAKNTDDIITIGMRGDGDEAMSEDADTKLLQKIVNNQRRIIKEVTGKNPKDVPQVWALYKEVLDYYDKGMKVPDDVLMLLCDDNWGNVRRVPNAQERKHPGGWGLYYHVDYVGAPRNSKWLNVTPAQNMWEQLTLAYTHGIDRMWILNVGDLKPMEYPITLFMDMAWKPSSVSCDVVSTHMTAFCEQAFGAAHAEEAARILNLCCKYAGRSTVEMLDRNTYNLQTGEWQQVVSQYQQLERDALRLYTHIAPEYYDAYRELILFPVQAMANAYELYYAQAMNHQLYKEQNPDYELWANRVEQLFRRDSLLCAQYNHDIAGGKWNGMMTQKHFGYVIWNDDWGPKDVMPAVYRDSTAMPGATSPAYIFTAKDGYVSIEAEHTYARTDASSAQWTVLPYVGRTLSGLTLMPYDKPVNGAALSYRFDSKGSAVTTAKVHVIVKSTLDYLNIGGLCYEVSLDGSAPVKVNFNSELNEKPENIYSIYYPTVARRVIEKVVELPIANASDGKHTLTLRPLHPAIVFEKVVIDLGGYQPSFLFGDESPKVIEVRK